MSRTADYTIQGFLYQFNKTAMEILSAQYSDTITVEGIIEDVEITSHAGTTAIQCKYHEASTAFNASALYKPLLQMLEHYSRQPSNHIKYVLYAYFSSVKDPAPDVGKGVLQAALESSDKELKKYIEKIPSDIDLEEFLCRFTMEFGKRYDQLVSDVHDELETNGFNKDDIETLIYPNMIHDIALLSKNHEVAKREITKKDLLKSLHNVRKTAISRWTLSLQSRSKLIEARRKQLKAHLNTNSRTRYFLIDPESIEDFEEQIVLFVSDYIDKYHYKPAHIKTPLICVCADRGKIQEIQYRLYKKDVYATDGYVGGNFEEPLLFREPFSSKPNGGKVRREFDVRVLSWSENGQVINHHKCDDIFIVGDLDISGLDLLDVNVERFQGVNMKEVQYMMGVRNDYE